MIEADGSTKFSPSKLSTYRECPRRYQFRYIDKIPRSAQSVEAFLGTCVHKAFEALYEGLRAGRPIAQADAIAVFEGEWHAGWSAAITRRDASIQPEHWREVGRQCIGNYYAQWAPFDQDRTVAVEQRIGFPIEVEGKTYRLEGFIDRLAISKRDEAFEIHDFKTAKTLPAQQHVDDDWQLALYEIAVRHQWPDTRQVRLVWHYVRHGKTLVSGRTPLQLEALKAQASALIGEIKRDHEFLPRRTALCDWCEYRAMCPLFAHAEKLARLEPGLRGADEGLQAVDELERLDERKRSLRGQIKEIEAQEDAIEKRLLDYAEKGGLQAVAGTHCEATIKAKEEYRFPTKSVEPERLAALESQLKDSPLWIEVSHFDSHRFLDGYKGKRWPPEWMEAAANALARFAQRARERTLRLRRRRDADE